MLKKVIVLGAKGRFGRAAVKAFAAAGWQVHALGRNLEQERFPEGVQTISCDARHEGDVIAACQGMDVIVNALNPPYTDWEEMLPVFTRNTLAAARASGATIMLIDNIYCYGTKMPVQISEATPHKPDTKKGRLRHRMEADYRAAAMEGVQSILLRGGDFIEGKDTGNWFETYLIGSLEKGRLMSPGDPDICHAWAYLPDMAKALVMLAEKRRDLPCFDSFGFEGFSISGREMKQIIEQHLGRDLKLKAMPWFAIKLLSPFRPMLREVLEMRYLWDVPHAIDGRKLRRCLPGLQNRSFSQAMQEILEPDQVENKAVHLRVAS